jgi:UDP:flavonoid glycosyltransferase YjiC (YdhE family)
VLDGLATVDADVVVATGIADPDGLARVPANVHVAGLVRLAALLPHLDTVVHHGGCGTTTAAWAHAVPQVVMPDGADRFVNAAAVVASGAGVALDAPAPDEVATSVREVLGDPSFARAARAVRAEMDAMPHPTRVLAALTDVRDRVRS